MSSIIDEDIAEDIKDPELENLKEKIAQIPNKYPTENLKEPDSLVSSLVNSFHQNSIKNVPNESFHLKEVSKLCESDFNDEAASEKNEMYTLKKEQKSFDSNINSRKILDYNEEKLSSNISIINSNKITSNLSFNQEKLTKNEENLSSNISNHSKTDLNISKNSNINDNNESSNKSFKKASPQKRNSKNFNELDKLSYKIFKNDLKEDQNLKKVFMNDLRQNQIIYKDFSTDSNIHSKNDLSEKYNNLSSNLSFSSAEISKTDSNLSFPIRKLIGDKQEINSNLTSFEDILDTKNPKSLENNQKKRKSSVKIGKTRPQTANLRKKSNENNEILKKPIENLQIKVAKPTKKPLVKSVKKQENLKKILKKGIKEEKEEEEKENDEIKPKTFLIKRLNSKENHKDLVKKIMEDYEKKENNYKEKEADLFVLETMEKKHLVGDENYKKECDIKKKQWNKDTKLEKFDIEEHKKQVKQTVSDTQNKAAKFLLELQAKMNKKNKAKINNYVEENNNENDEIFGEIKNEEGDQLLPNKKEENTLFEEENEKNLAGDQLLPNEFKKPENSQNKKKDEEKFNENNQIQNNSKGNNKSSHQNSINNKEEKPSENIVEMPDNPPIENENTWKYPIGNGQISEYNKTQKTHEIKEKQEATQISKVQSQHQMSKKQKMLEIEKELRKKQKEIALEQKDTAQIAKPIKVLEKSKDKNIIDRPSNIQNEAKAAEKKEIDAQSLRAFKLELNEIIRQNKDLKTALKSLLTEKEILDDKITKLKKNQKVICLPNGKFTSFGFVPAIEEEETKISTKDHSEKPDFEMSDNMSLASEERNKALDTSLTGRIVNKIALGGLTLTQVFDLLDFDGDKILTMSEIKSNLPKLNLNLSNEEISELIKQLDSNTDGIINKEEFINCLEKPLEIEQEYYQIMGNIKDIDNPLIMEERKMEIFYRKKLVLEEIEKEQNENLRNQADYNKTTAKLKKYEKIFNKSHRNTLEHKNENKKNLANLQTIVRNLEGELEKSEGSYHDKMIEIEDNLNSLQEELMNKAQKMLEAKDLLNSQKTLYQKLQIKQISYDKISEKLKKNLELINENEIKLNENIQEHLKIKASRNENSLKMLHFAVNTTYLLIKVQSYFRMKLAQKYCKALKEKTLSSKIKIISQFRQYLKMRRAKKFQKHIFSIFFKHMGIFFKKIQQFASNFNEEEIFQDKEIEKGDELLPSFSLKSMKKQNSVIEEPVEIKMIEKSIEQDYLISALTIQKKFRGEWNTLKKEAAKLELNFGSVENFCTYCKKFGRGEKSVERICRKCKDAFFCLACFETYHKSKQIRNHAFYDLAKNAENLLDNEENLRVAIETICLKLKGGKYEKLEKEFEGEDRGAIGLIKEDLAENLLIDAIGAENDGDIKKMVRFVCQVAVVKYEKAAVKFKDDKNRLEKKNYVDYEKVLILLISARDQPKEAGSEVGTPLLNSEKI